MNCLVIRYRKGRGTYDRENLTLNCQHVQPSIKLPSASVKDSPSWMSLSRSTLQRSV